MTLCQATLSPQGSFRSQLQSDTFFGAFCWAYLRRHGREALEDLLAQLCAGTHELVFSNAFPAGCLPLPLGVFDPRNDFDRLEDKVERRDAYRRGKKLKNAKYVTKTAFFKIQAGDWAGFTSSLRGENTVSASEMHNLVLRDQGIVNNIDGAGNLFTTEVRFPDARLSEAERCFELYVLSDLPEAELRDTLSLALQLGIGGDKSTGRGIFSLIAWEAADSRLSICPDSNGFLALSNFIPAIDDPTQGLYRTMTKYPVLDQEMGGQNPFKKPLLFLTAGSVFFDAPPRPAYGRYLTKVAASDAPITTNARTIAVPMVLKETQRMASEIQN